MVFSPKYHHNLLSGDTRSSAMESAHSFDRVKEITSSLTNRHQKMILVMCKGAVADPPQTSWTKEQLSAGYKSTFKGLGLVSTLVVKYVFFLSQIFVVVFNMIYQTFL